MTEQQPQDNQEETLSDAERERLGDKFDKTFRTLDGEGMPDGQVVATIVALKKQLKRLDLSFGAILDMAASGGGAQNGQMEETLKAFEEANNALKANEEFLTQENDRISRLLSYYRARHRNGDASTFEFDEDELEETLAKTVEKMDAFATAILPLLTMTDAKKKAQTHYEARVGDALAAQPNVEIEKNSMVKALLWMLRAAGHDTSPERMKELQDMVAAQGKTIKEISEGVIGAAAQIDANLKEVGPKLDLLRGATAPQADYDAAMQDIKDLTETVEQLKTQNDELQAGAAEVQRLKDKFKEYEEDRRTAEQNNFSGQYKYADADLLLTVRKLRDEKERLEKECARGEARFRYAEVNLKAAVERSADLSAFSAQKDSEILAQRARMAELGRMISILSVQKVRAFLAGGFLGALIVVAGGFALSHTDGKFTKTAPDDSGAVSTARATQPDSAQVKPAVTNTAVATGSQSVEAKKPAAGEETKEPTRQKAPASRKEKNIPVKHASAQVPETSGLEQAAILVLKNEMNRAAQEADAVVIKDLDAYKQKFLEIEQRGDPYLHWSEKKLPHCYVQQRGDAIDLFYYETQRNNWEISLTRSEKMNRGWINERGGTQIHVNFPRPDTLEIERKRGAGLQSQQSQYLKLGLLNIAPERICASVTTQDFKP